VIVLARNLRAAKLDAVVAIAQIQPGVDSSRLLCCSGRVGRGDRVGDQAISGAPMPDEWFATQWKAVARFGDVRPAGLGSRAAAG
jgi:hypothetical protein